MSVRLVTKNLAGGHAHRTLFESLDLSVAPGDVVGVVGANGAGKTTLLRILAGDLGPLGGSVSTAPNDAFVGWLPQEHERVECETVLQYVGRRTGAAAATEAVKDEKITAFRKAPRLLTDDTNGIGAIVASTA